MEKYVVNNMDNQCVECQVWPATTALPNVYYSVLSEIVFCHLSIPRLHRSYKIGSGMILPLFCNMPLKNVFNLYKYSQLHMWKVYKLKCLDKQVPWDEKNHHNPSKFDFLSHLFIFFPVWPLYLPSSLSYQLIFLRLWIILQFQELC